MGGEKCRHLLQQYPLQALLHGRQLRFEHVRGDELREHLPAADGGGVGVFASVSACRAVPGAAAAVAASVVAGVTVVTAIVPRLGPPGRSEVRGTTSGLRSEAAGNAETWADRAVCIGGGRGGAGRAGGFTPQRYLGRAGMMAEERREVSARVCAKCASPRRRVEEDHRSSNAVAVWLLG